MKTKKNMVSLFFWGNERTFFLLIFPKVSVEVKMCICKTIFVPCPIRRYVTFSLANTYAWNFCSGQAGFRLMYFIDEDILQPRVAYSRGICNAHTDGVEIQRHDAMFWST